MDKYNLLIIFMINCEKQVKIPIWKKKRNWKILTIIKQRQAANPHNWTVGTNKYWLINVSINELIGSTTAIYLVHHLGCVSVSGRIFSLATHAFYTDTFWKRRLLFILLHSHCIFMARVHIFCPTEQVCCVLTASW